MTREEINLRKRQSESVKKNGRNGTRRYRLRKSKLIEIFTMKEWLNKLDETNGYCPKCNIFVGKNKLELDHIIPISKATIGFAYTINDIQPLCRSCNSKKGNKYE